MQSGLGAGKTSEAMENNPNGFPILDPCTFSVFTYVQLHCY